MRLTYFGNDSGREFDILINNQKLATVILAGKRGSYFYDVDYKIPSAILDSLNHNDNMTVKFKAHEGSVAGGIYHIRLLKDN